MDDRRRKLAAIVLVVGFLLIVAIIVGVINSARKTLSPVPEEPAIRVIFLTPTPGVSLPLSATSSAQ